MFYLRFSPKLRYIFIFVVVSSLFFGFFSWQSYQNRIELNNAFGSLYRKGFIERDYSKEFLELSTREDFIGCMADFYLWVNNNSDIKQLSTITANKDCPIFITDLIDSLVNVYSDSEIELDLSSKNIYKTSLLISKSIQLFEQKKYSEAEFYLDYVISDAMTSDVSRELSKAVKNIIPK